MHANPSVSFLFLSLAVVVSVESCLHGTVQYRLKYCVVSCVWQCEYSKVELCHKRPKGVYGTPQHWEWRWL